MSAEELLKKAAACEMCGKEHKYRLVGVRQGSWAAEDGHGYRPVVDVGTVAKLRYLATGTYVDPWQLPQSVPGKAASAVGLSR